MTTIELKFVANRFHATPWGRHVNEGVPEWPPSPYRLLRALYDTWRRKHSELPESLVSSVFEALATEPPRFHLPAATASHTRSYLSSNSEDPTDKSLIFDAFVVTDPAGACYVTWPSLDLGDEQRRPLTVLLGSLNFLGRSESWVEARLIDTAIADGTRCEPASASEDNGELVSVACATPVSRYKEKRSWMDALAYSTTDLIKERRSSPPALSMVPYVRPENTLMTHVPRSRVSSGSPVQAVMLALDSTVLPLITATIEVAEQIRSRLMGIHKRIVGDRSKVSPKFSGKSPEGKPLEDHSHVFILPLSNERGRLDRVLIYTRASEGFSREELQAILEVRSLWRRGDPEHPIRSVVSWKGLSNDKKVRAPKGVVVSDTPFITVRHWRKGRGDVLDFLKEEVRRECRNHSLPEPVGVDLLPHAPGLFEWIEFRRNRKDDPPRPGYGFRIEFPEPVACPFTLGYGCHYGLGRFEGA